MNIFGVGGWELAAVLIIALIVAGPKRMAQWAFILGKFAGQLRLMWSDMMAQVQKEFDDAGVDVQVPKNLPTRNEINKSLNKAFEPVSKPVRDAVNEFNEETRAIGRGVSSRNGNVNEKANGHHQVEELPEYTVELPPGRSEKPKFGTWSGTTESDDEDGKGQVED